MGITRKWINQPSALQQYHKLHGTHVLYDSDKEEIYFLSGNTISQQYNTKAQALSDGWPNHDGSYIERIKQALRDYHYSLDIHENGDVAAHNTIHIIEKILNMPWERGYECGMRDSKNEVGDS